MRLMPFSGLPCLILLSGLSAFGLDNSVARTPPMGWSTFNQFSGVWTPDRPAEWPPVNVILKAIADSLVSTGLHDCGYEYVNCDGANGGNAPFWPGYTGFVSWAKPNADYIHSQGLKFGVYTSEFSNPQKIAADLAAANVDFIKVDAWTSEVSDPGWAALGTALESAGRPIVYSTHSSQPGVSHMQRTGSDINPTWQRWTTGDFDPSNMSLATCTPGNWADPDMLTVGVTVSATEFMTDDESRSMFSMWCMMSAPLIMGYNISRMWPVDYSQNNYAVNDTKFPMADHVKFVAIHSNVELIALDQDTIGLAGRRISGQGTLEVWIKNCADGSKAVAFFNRTSESMNMNITKTELEWGGASKIYVRDLWQHENLEPFTASFTMEVASHATEVFRMDTKPIIEPTAILRRMDRSIAWLAANGHDVFSRSRMLSVLAGNNAHVRVLDACGRILAVNPAPGGSGICILSSIAGDNSTMKFLRLSTPCESGGRSAR